ncbi:chitosanase [Methylobacter sp.]|uniref:VgrG-related protein n=1 Tax=Methylobacter sp. TaxID=2051955 RepID=UPI002487C988|nr:chitosanase [Methylobacter sp.]MDI1277285.1 chitosanase [Methylobacter sp.]MDI1357851.1 chitosanase [Methylobacter sp.]
MTLEHDAQGFLTGEPVDISKAVDQLRGIRSDVSAIKQAFLSLSTNTAKPDNSKILSGSNAPVSRDNSPVNKVNTPELRSQGVAEQLIKPVKSSGVDRKRNASGQFVAKGQSPDNENKDRSEKSMLGGFADRIAAAVSSTASGVEDADPTVKAFQEVATPMMRGYQVFSGGNNKKDGWFKKILKELGHLRKDESISNKSANKTLKNIEGKPGGGGGEGDQSFLGGLLGSISPWVMTAITGIGTALLAGIGTVLGVIFSPIGLGIGVAAAAAWGLFTEDGRKFFADMGSTISDGWNKAVIWFTESSPKTMELLNKGLEKVNEGVDFAVKAGDALNDAIKEKTGVDVKQTVKDAHAKTVQYTADNIIAPGAEAVKKAKDDFVASSPKTMGLIDKGLGYISSRYEGNIGSAHKDNIGSAYGKYQFNTQGGLPQFLKDNPKYAAQLAEGGAPGSAGFNKKWEQIAKDDPDGFRAAQEASGKKQYFDPAMAKAGSLGFDTADRGIQEAMFSGAVQHGGWSSKVLPEIAKNYDLKSMSAPDQLKAIYAERRKYAAKNLKGNDLKNVLSRYDREESNTVDLSKSEHDIGTVTTDAAPSVNADIPKPTASIAEDPTQGGRYKYETLEGGSVQVTDSQDGTISLASDEQANAYRREQGKPYKDKVAAINADDIGLYNKLAGNGSAPTETNAMPSLHNLAAGVGSANQTQTAYASVPSVPKFSPSPTPAETPAIITPLASGDSGRNVTVTMPNGDVGQDVKDRRIAHIVTGGMSGMG